MSKKKLWRGIACGEKDFDVQRMVGTVKEIVKAFGNRRWFMVTALDAKEVLQYEARKAVHDHQRCE